MSFMFLKPREVTNSLPADGRVFFTAPNLFVTSLCLGGAQQHDGWFFVDVEFLLNIGGDMTGTQGAAEVVFTEEFTDEVFRISPQAGWFDEATHYRRG